MSKNLDTVRASFPGVELLKVGDWGGITGRAKIGPDDITEAIAAAADPMVDDSPLKFGHFSNLGDGEPAPGWVANLRASEDGSTLLGDFVNVPSKLVPLIRDGFRRRSVELKHNVTGTGGRVYKSTLKALALLGVAPPAVKGLNALADLYASEVADEDLDVIYLGEEAPSDTPRVPHPAAATGNDSNNGPATGPTETVGKDAETMAFKDALLAKLGLKPEATDEEIEAAIEAAKLEAPADDAADKDDKDDKDDKAADKPETALGAPETITVSKAVWEETQNNLRGLMERAAKSDVTARVETALAEGKIAPAEVSAYETLLSESPEAGTTLLSSLPVRFSTSAIGVGGSGVTTEAEEKAMHAAADELGL